MASISFDPSTGWWSVRYLATPGERVKKTLCRHPGPWSKARPPRKVPPEVRELAAPFVERERLARLGATVTTRARDLRKYVDEYVSGYRASHRPNSVARLEAAAEKFLAWCAGRGVATVQAVTVERCDEWIAGRLAGGMKRSTVATERAYLAPIWAKARRHRVVAENPWEVARVPGKAGPPQLKYWTIEELKLLFAACEGWLRDYVVLDCNLGLRASAMCGLTFADVDFPGNRVVVPAGLSKNGRPYAVPLSATAAEVLGRRWLASGDEKALVFPSVAKGKRMDPSQVRRKIKEAALRAGIRDIGRYSHALRHSFAVALVEADVHMRVIQDLLGHQSIRTTEIYAKVAPSKAQAAMGKFDLPGPVTPKASGPGTSRGPAKSPSG